MLNMHNNFMIYIIILGLVLNFNSLILILVMPATKAITKRSFSALRKVKT